MKIQNKTNNERTDTNVQADKRITTVKERKRKIYQAAKGLLKGGHAYVWLNTF